jgi:hypothetical protein
MKFYKSVNGVVVYSNESTIKVLRITISIVALILVGVLSGSAFEGLNLVFITLLCIFIIVMIVMRLAIEIDSRNSRYRQSYRIFGMSTGTWVKVKELSYISLFPTLGSRGRGEPMVGAMITGDVYMKELRINLVVNNRERILLQSNMKEKSARKFTLELGEILEIGVFDCTGTENVWLRPRS